MENPHILIIGAGITGLLLAQALKKYEISFAIYERDPDPHHRGKGWGLALHWALETMLSLMPQHLIERLPETYCDPIATAHGEHGNFPFFDLSTGEARWTLPSNIRRRVSREKLRSLLMDGVEIQWHKSLVDVVESSEGGITAHFEGGFSASGTQLVGCDGSRSVVRRIVCALRGSRWQNQPVQVRLMGASVVYTSSVGRSMQEYDRFFFQGGDPKTDSFLFFAIQDTPENNERDERDTYACQVVVSWPYRAGFLGRSEPLEIPDANEERVRLMKEITEGWMSPFRDRVHEITSDTPVQAICLEDWPPQEGTWDNLNGKATLIGDAAHAMTMYRGEAANHGIADVKRWLDFHLPVIQAQEQNSSTLMRVCNEYEREMVKRTRPAVLASRSACRDAHEYKRIND